MATLKASHCFEFKINIGYGATMFKSLLLISCLGSIVGCGEDSEIEPTVVEPTVVEPTVIEPTVAEPTVVEPTVVEPTVVEPTVVEPTVVEPTVADPSRVWGGNATDDNLDELFSGGYTTITGYLKIRDTQIDIIDLPQLQKIVEAW